MERRLLGTLLKFLSLLKKNDLTSINRITFLADAYKDNPRYSRYISRTILLYMTRVSSEMKMTLLSVVDKIIKTIGSQYNEIFEKYIIYTFLDTYKTNLDHRIRIKLYKMRLSWSEFFPTILMNKLDRSVKKFDPTWPLVEKFHQDFELIDTIVNQWSPESPPYPHGNQSSPVSSPCPHENQFSPESPPYLHGNELSQEYPLYPHGNHWSSEFPPYLFGNLWSPKSQSYPWGNRSSQTSPPYALSKRLLSKFLPYTNNNQFPTLYHPSNQYTINYPIYVPKYPSQSNTNKWSPESPPESPIFYLKDRYVLDSPIYVFRSASYYNNNQWSPESSHCGNKLLTLSDERDLNSPIYIPNSLLQSDSNQWSPESPPYTCRNQQPSSSISTDQHVLDSPIYIPKSPSHYTVNQWSPESPPVSPIFHSRNQSGKYPQNNLYKYTSHFNNQS